MALCRRVRAGEVTRPYHGLYAAAGYWENLTPPEQSLHMARTLTQLHREWVFAGIIAAAAYGFEHQWLLHNGSLTVAAQDHGQYHPTTKLRTLHMSKPDHELPLIQGVRVTDKARTAVDCGLLLEFRFALPIMDSALAQGVTIEEIQSVCANLHRDCSNVFRLLHYATPASENGGESLARATLLEFGFQNPNVQVPFIDPHNSRTYRADFVWFLPDRRIIVGEFDGQQKYVDPAMTGGESVADVVLDERERQEGLKRAGVSTIFRFTYRDVMDRRPLLRKASAAGVPMRSIGL